MTRATAVLLLLVQALWLGLVALEQSMAGFPDGHLTSVDKTWAWVNLGTLMGALTLWGLYLFKGWPKGMLRLWGYQGLVFGVWLVLTLTLPHWVRVSY